MRRVTIVWQQLAGLSQAYVRPQSGLSGLNLLEMEQAKQGVMINHYEEVDFLQ